MPDAKLRKRLIETYFKTLHHIQAMIHPQTFMQREQRGENSDLLILAICAATSIFVEEAENSNTPPYYLGEPFASRAQHIIQQNLMKPSLETAQALGTLFIYEFNAGNFGICQMYLELAFHYIKLSRIYRLDEDYQDDTLLSPKLWVEKETKRRIFWLITIKDRIISSELGVPQLVDLFDCEVQLPCEEYYWEHSLPITNVEKMDSDEEEMAIGMSCAPTGTLSSHPNQYGIRIKIILILGQISRYANRPKTKQILSKRSLTARFAVLEYALSAWWHHLPPELRKDDNMNSESVIPSVELIQHYKMVYYGATILLHRTYLAHMADLYNNTSQSVNPSIQDVGISVPESCRASMTKCTSTAFAVTRMIENYQQFKLSWFNLFSSQTVFLASTIHLNNIFSSTGDLKEQSKKAYEINVNFLKSIKDCRALAEFQLKILQKLELVCSNINRHPNSKQHPGTISMQWIAPTSTGSITWQDTLEEAFDRYCDTPFKDLTEASLHQRTDILASPDNPFRVGFSQDVIPLPEININLNPSQLQVAGDPNDPNPNYSSPDLIIQEKWKSELNPVCYDRLFVEKIYQESGLSSDFFDFFPLFDTTDNLNI
ncbi:hypothetical protein K7432_006544 [Basidiobolus ranarum]|uniref:Xylanolytic transcriptional activator regulatory domain-containing protein n=1 Tax=Basidiobolus ranarum TaxID=34480 RepID=A0ABR2W1G2_9FUNG